MGIHGVARRRSGRGGGRDRERVVGDLARGRARHRERVGRIADVGVIFDRACVGGQHRLRA